MANWPLGTPDELAQIGMDPTRRKCCAPEGETVSTENGLITAKGCQFYRMKDERGNVIRECIFAKQEHGGFRDHGPRNVAVWINLSPADLAGDRELPASGTIIHPCFLFENNLRDRYDQQFATGETIRIEAQEGEKVVVEKYVTEANPYAPDRPTMKKVEEEIEVPKFPRPAERFRGEVRRQATAAKVLKQMDADQNARIRESLEKMAGPQVLKEPDGERIGKGR